MPIVDFHAHIFPGAIAEKAAASIGRFYQLPVMGDGRADTLLQWGDEAGVDRFVVHSVATLPGHVRSINDFIASKVREHPGRFVGFAALHPDLPDPAAEVRRAIDLGLSGVKLHPDIQRFALNGPKSLKMFECFAGTLPALVHAGDRRYANSRPAQVAEVLDRFPPLTMIGAHLGGWSEWGDACAILAGRPNFYVDCSSSLYALPPGEAARIVRAYGADRVLFGSDYPMWPLQGELDRLRTLNLTADELERILYKNAEQLLGLEMR
ncbi:MAG: amidohydrolase [Clostridiales bacterium]|nr:amidohydrolase [Clostridiales bacterium]